MFVQKTDIVEGKIVSDILGKVKADELESGVADKYYIHEQTTASEVWVITHNLQKKPSVASVDSAGTVVFGYVEYMNENTLKITFKYPFTGLAYCN